MQSEPNTNNPNWENLKYLIDHKINVVKAGREFDAPLLPLLAHDYSKFKPRNWGPYRDWFFGPEGRLAPEGKGDPEVYTKFREAAKDHYGTENHHLHKRTPPTALKDIPLNTRREILADWYSISRHMSENRKNFPKPLDWVRDSGYTDLLK